MIPRRRVVLDTNALVSRLLLPRSVPARAVQRAIASHQVLMSEATIMELAGVLSRSKFDRYVTLDERKEFLRLLGRVVEIVPVIHVIRACRDPRGDKFLELAVNGGADIVVTGDADLLALHPFRDIPVVPPTKFLEQDSACLSPADRV
jgi:putative PIN family toxin of toxin-antitoxin system